MIKKLILSSTAALGLTACPLTLAKLNVCLEVFPYVGLDAQERHMSFEEGYGDNLLYHTAPQGNTYVGLRVEEHFAIEAGYEATVTRSRERTLGAGELAAGQPVPATSSPAVFKSKLTIKGPHLDLLGLYPLYNYKGAPIEILGSIGVAFLKATSERQTISLGNTSSSMVRTLNGRKAVLRTAIGLQYKFCDQLGVRATVGWVNTSKLTISANDNIRGMYLPEIKPKKTTFCGLGLVWTF